VYLPADLVQEQVTLLKGGEVSIWLKMKESAPERNRVLTLSMQQGQVRVQDQVSRSRIQMIPAGCANNWSPVPFSIARLPLRHYLGYHVLLLEDKICIELRLGVLRRGARAQCSREERCATKA
jgi:hypothetical protein